MLQEETFERLERSGGAWAAAEVLALCCVPCLDEPTSLNRIPEVPQTVLLKGTVSLSPGEVLHRVRDGLTLRITGDGRLQAAPPGALNPHCQMRAEVIRL